MAGTNVLQQAVSQMTPTPIPYQGTTSGPYIPQTNATAPRPSGADRQFYQPIYPWSYSNMPQSTNPMSVSSFNPYAQSNFYQPQPQPFSGYQPQPSPYGGKGGIMQSAPMGGGMQSAPMGGGKGGATMGGFGMAKGGLTSYKP
jgi:hypothetical protein